MTSSPDTPPLLASLDTLFTPPSREQWVEMAVAGLGGEQRDSDALLKLRRTTLEGIPLEVLYDTTDHSVNLAISSDRTSWDNRLCVRVDKEQTTSAAREQILQGLQGGITSIELHISSAAQLPECLAGTQLDLAPVSIRSNRHYAACADALVACSAQQGIEPTSLHCAFNADPVGAALATPMVSETTVQSISDELAVMAEFAKDNSQRLPSTRSILVDTAIHHNAGASTVEEIHAALATATLYLEALLDAGMSIDKACEQIVFQVAMDADILLGVAKLRAIRALWQRVVSSLGNCGSNAQAHRQPAVIVAETSQRFTSLSEPWNNHLRNLSASTAAALGSADTLLVHPHDALQRRGNTDINVDTHLGDRMARNIAIILERECGLLKVCDPMAGSYAIENLTHQLMEHSWESLASTDTGEGWLDELHSGRWKTRLAHTHRQRVTLMEQEQRIAVGVNRFVQADDTHQAARSADRPDNRAAEQAIAAEPSLAPVRDSTTFEHGINEELRS